MSERRTIDFTTRITAYGDESKLHHQYGMRYPDGTIRWDKDGDGIEFWRLTSDNESSAERDRYVNKWAETLERRANNARIDVETYTNGHTLIKRFIMVAVTIFEEV